MERNTKYGIDKKVVILGIATFAGFLYIASYSHELGHIAVCNAYGFRSELIISPYTLDTRASTCHGHPDNLLLFRSMGGIAGFAASMVPVVFLRKYKFIIIGCVPNATANVLAAIMETFFHEWYSANAGGVPAAVTFGSMITVATILLLKYATANSTNLRARAQG